VQRGIYLPEERRFRFETMHELVFGGPCRHRDGNILNNHRENLVAVVPAVFARTLDQEEAAEVAAQQAAEAAKGLVGSIEGSAEVIDPFSPEAFDQAFSPEE